MSHEVEQGRDETELERLDRNLMELLGELRVALPGVQVLFAFLLTVPFASGFAGISLFEKYVYFGTLVATAISAVLLMAPAAHHRVEFAHHDKAHLVTVANRFMLVGLAFLAMAMSGALLLITDYLFTTLAAVITTTIAVLMFATFWYAIPYRRRDQLRKAGGAR